MNRLGVCMVFSGLLVGVALPARSQILGTGVTPTLEVPGPQLTAAVATALSTADTAANTSLLVADSVKNLLPVEVVVVADGIVEDLALIGEILSQIEELSMDVNSLVLQLNTLFNLDLAPDTSAGLKERLAEVRQIKAKCFTTAMKVQNLIFTTFKTVDHAIQLVNNIAILIGQQQNLQVLNQQMSSVTKEITKLQVVTSSFFRAQSFDKLEELLIGESRRRITAKVYGLE